jgi:hypothetical protein
MSFATSSTVANVANEPDRHGRDLDGLFAHLFKFAPLLVRPDVRFQLVELFVERSEAFVGAIERRPRSFGTSYFVANFAEYTGQRFGADCAVFDHVSRKAVACCFRHIFLRFIRAGTVD